MPDRFMALMSVLVSMSPSRRLVSELVGWLFILISLDADVNWLCGVDKIRIWLWVSGWLSLVSVSYKNRLLISVSVGVEDLVKGCLCCVLVGIGNLVRSDLCDFFKVEDPVKGVELF